MWLILCDFKCNSGITEKFALSSVRVATWQRKKKLPMALINAAIILAIRNETHFEKEAQVNIEMGVWLTNIKSILFPLA